ncbi:hypothetical protein [Lachnospira eligens]|nr:hypothetical protein [Lachnospira eligens]
MSELIAENLHVKSERSQLYGKEKGEKYKRLILDAFSRWQKLRGRN